MRRVTIKTPHGALAFVTPRFQDPPSGQRTTSRDVTEQLCEGAISARVAACSAYASNRMRYAEVAGLLERVTGQRLRSDQTMQHLGVAKAVEGSRQWHRERQGATVAPACPVVMPHVDWDDPPREDILGLPEAMHGKQHQAHRDQEPCTPAVEGKTQRVNTDGWLGEQAPGGLLSLRAGIDATGQEGVSATDRARWQCQQDDGERSAPLPVVAMTDGAKTIRCQLAELCGQPVPLILDGSHLDKQVGEFMRMSARHKQEHEGHVVHLLDSLWHGRTAAALASLQTVGRPKNTKKRQE